MKRKAETGGRKEKTRDYKKQGRKEQEEGEGKKLSQIPAFSAFCFLNFSLSARPPHHLNSYTAEIVT